MTLNERQPWGALVCSSISTGMLQLSDYSPVVAQSRVRGGRQPRRPPARRRLRKTKRPPLPCRVHNQNNCTLCRSKSRMHIRTLPPRRRKRFLLLPQRRCLFAVLCCRSCQTLHISNAFDGRLTTKLRSKGTLMLCKHCLEPKLCSQLPSLLASATMQRRVS